MSGEMWDFLFGGRNEDDVPSWDNVGNTEGLPIVETVGHNGYHRAFFMLPNAKREWFFAKKIENGWEPVSSERYVGIGRSEPDAGGGVRARVFVEKEGLAGGEEQWISLPALSD